MSDRGHDETRELLPAYALDALGPDERRRVEGHLASGCDRCAAELAELERVLGVLGESAPPVSPPPGARERLLSLVGAEPSHREGERDRRAVPRRAGWLAAAALGAVALVGGWILWETTSRADRLRQENAELRQTVEEQRERIGALERERTELARHISFLVGRSTEHVRLAALEAAPGATGRAVVDRDSGRGQFFAYGLPPLATDRTYQLWYIVDGEPLSAGIFEVGTDGVGTVDVEVDRPLDAIQTWAVTVEPEGGVPEPTGEMVLKS